MLKKVDYDNLLKDNNIYLMKGKRKVEDKQVSTVRKITGELIGGFILYGLIFGLLYSLVYSSITDLIPENMFILTSSISIILQGITAFCIWRCSIVSTFKKDW